MAKDKSELSKEERRALKKQKKESKLVAPQDSKVSKASSEKKDKKEKKAKREALAEKALNEIQNQESAKDAESDENGSEEENNKNKEKKAVVLTRPTGPLVPFANPLVTDEKSVKKIFKIVKKAAAQRALKRGVKEVVKAVRRSPTSQPPSSGGSSPIGVVVLAADISPMDVISHIPVLCEDHNIPYAYVKSRAELGMAGQTKRPTSVVMINRDLVKRKDGEGKKQDGADDTEEWPDVYKGLVKLVEKEGRNVTK